MERKTLFNDGWQFHMGELEQKPCSARSKTGMCGGAANLTNAEGGFYPLPERFWGLFGAQGKEAGNQVVHLVPELTDSWEPVSLPHDWHIRQDYINPGDTANSEADMTNVGSDSLPNGVGYYRKVFSLPAEAEGQRLFLEFEGVMHNASIWMNGFLIAQHFSGYSGFAVDISEYANYGDEGKNALLVRTDSEELEGWWSDGAGIYRDIWLTCVPMVHIARDGIFARTTLLEKDHAEVRVSAELENSGAESWSGNVCFRLYDPNGVLATQETVCADTKAFANGSAEVTFQLEQPALWDLEHPNLYRAEVELTDGASDKDSVSFGVRTVEYTQKGLLLNGQLVDLKGVCVHQDFAGVGSAMTRDILHYRLQRIKDMGGNAYRSAHHAATRALLEECDRMGILVLNEVRHFDVQAESIADLQDMIRGSRNHPCVFMYCMENEEFIECIPQGRRILKRMIALGHALDDTRAFTTATQFGRDDVDYLALTDVAGYNYDNGQAQTFLQAYPKGRVMATEDVSFLSTRGVYEDSPEHGWCDCYEGENYYFKIMRRNGIDPGTMGGAVSSLELTHTYFNNRIKTPQLGGMFLWTAFDYRGETFPWNWPAVVSSYGAMDYCGFEKDSFYYWRSLWTSEPMVHCLPGWDLAGQEGQTVRIELYSNCQEVELFVNDVSVGRKAHTLGRVTSWEVTYQPGTLRAVGYNDGVQAAEQIHRTPGEPAMLKLEPVHTGEQDVLVKVSVTDDAGLTCLRACLPVTFTAEGGTVIGVGNGDPACHESDVTNTRTTFNGLGLAIIRRNGSEPLTVTAETSGFPKAVCTL